MSEATAREVTDSDAVDTLGGAVEAAGHFRIYLGAAAGVGKTYAMLNEARRRRDRPPVGTSAEWSSASDNRRRSRRAGCSDLRPHLDQQRANEPPE